MLLHLCVRFIKHEHISASAAKLLAQTFAILQFHVLVVFLLANCRCLYSEEAAYTEPLCGSQVEGGQLDVAL